jgi:hypothetical protein
MTTLDKSTAEILSPRMVAIFEQPHAIVFVGCPSISLLQVLQRMRKFSIIL